MPSLMIKITIKNYTYCYRTVIWGEIINMEVSLVEQNINKNKEYPQKKRMVHTN